MKFPKKILIISNKRVILVGLISQINYFTTMTSKIKFQRLIDMIKRRKSNKENLTL